MAITELEPLLTAPTEALDVEYKSWLELATNDEHKALLAKAAIAIANEGGGYIIVGLREERPNLISEPRPPGIAPYDQDLVNQIIRRFASPQFHCTLTIVRHPISGYEHAVIKVPGGFAFPVMSKSGTPQNSIRPHLCYMRKPGPESAAPENQADWERLLTKCLRNRREDMLDAIRVIVEGSAVATPEPTASQRQTIFVQAARASWELLTANLEANSPARCPFGRLDSAHADFWRASPDGRLFLLRGFGEDSERAGFEPGKTFDIVIPTWRLGEGLSHASKLASLLAPDRTDLRVLIRARWYGLRGRRLVSLDPNRMIFGDSVSRQDEYTIETTIDIARIADNLPEIIYPLIAPLYEGFGFFQLPLSLPSEEIARMRRRV